MAAPRDALSELSCKALVLVLKGHVASGLEKWRAALALALARTPQPPDCLIVAAIRAHILLASVLQCNLESVPAAVKLQALHEGVNTHLPAVVATLQQRRDARTLLDGRCRAEEEAWQRNQEITNLRYFGDPLVVRFSSLIGYEVHLNAAISALDLSEITVFARSEDLDSHWELSVALAEEAAAFMSAPRRNNDQSLAVEANLVHRLLRFGTTKASNRRNVLPEPLRARVAAAYRRLHDSRVLVIRRIAEQFARLEDENVTTTAIEAAASPGLRICALAACDAKEQHPSHFKSCAACKTVAYCCKEHQVQDWPAHKAACKAARISGAEQRPEAATPSGAAALGGDEGQ